MGVYSQNLRFYLYIFMNTQSTAPEAPVIGVFDSGVGGLTVVKELKRLLPGVPLIYFGDTARTPYGTKSASTIIQFAIEDTRFLLDQGANIVVVACHSASSTAKEALEDAFDCPIFEVVTPSVKEAAKATRNRRIGVIGTRATVGSRIYSRELGRISEDLVVIERPCPLLVPLVEEGWLERRETKMIVKKYLHPLRLQNIDTLVLGCTHYPMLKELIQKKMGKRVRIVDPSQVVAMNIKEYIARNMDQKGGQPARKDIYYFSDLGVVTREVIRRFIDYPIEVRKAAP